MSIGTDLNQQMTVVPHQAMGVHLDPEPVGKITRQLQK